MNTTELQAAIESFAPPSLQESWDNSGWNVNLHNENIRGVMICLDVTPEVVRAAADAGCQVVVSHHPLLFHAVRCVDTADPVSRCLSDLCREGISLYCAHTSADSTLGGINTWLGRTLGLKNTRPLVPQDVALCKMVVTVPPDQAETVRAALAKAGAGTLGAYSDCSFTASGEGRFRPSAAAHPAIGTAGVLETVAEERIEVLIPEALVAEATKAVLAVHPYEMPALDVYPLKNADDGKSGLGVAGDLEEPVTLREFAARVKEKLSAGVLHISGDLEAEVTRAGICGGSGHSLVSAAQAAGCDVFLTGELRHESYFGSRIPLIEAGHYDTEKCFVNILCEALQMSAPVIQYKVEVRAFCGDGRPYIDY